MSPEDRRLGQPRRWRGQHFLVDPNVRRRILAALRPQPSQVWLEIGAGHGELTAELVKSGADVWAVELDPALAAQLRERCRHFANLRVLTGDILAINLKDELSACAKRIHIYGSLPYYITSPILSRIFELKEMVAEATVIVQAEVAQRLVARPGSRAYGFLSVEAQWFAACSILFRIAPSAFRPRPKVWSALVRLAPPGRRHEFAGMATRQFLEFAGACFQQKRKTLLNNLRAKYGEEKVLAALGSRLLTKKVRAEELSIDELAGLYNLLET